ncbi:alpha/beta fold hydrolase [Capnocytophaga canimorsus]|uniref:alpha/beta fold hydrolase n=1 Tax=Capnocytophaga canimorsus TaxID=28188 RepID=UPI0037D76E12
MNPEPIHIYMMPGMAASPKIFEFLEFPSYCQIHLLDWILPLKEESLADYALRLSKNIKHESPVLIGVSFGGIIVQEIAKIRPYRKIIIISSVKTQHELPKKMLLARYTKIHKLLPLSLVDTMEYWKRFSFSGSITKRIELYEKYIGMRSPFYLEWSIDKIVNWQQENPLPRTIHIHGSKDVVFPIKYISNAITIEKGTHIMIINRHKWFNEHWEKLLKYEEID